MAPCNEVLPFSGPTMDSEPAEFSKEPPDEMLMVLPTVRLPEERDKVTLPPLPVAEEELMLPVTLSWLLDAFNKIEPELAPEPVELFKLPETPIEVDNRVMLPDELPMPEAVFVMLPVEIDPEPEMPEPR